VTCPSRVIAIEGRLLLLVGVAELVPRKVTSSLVSRHALLSTLIVRVSFLWTGR
jgi:hypothetical protein